MDGIINAKPPLSMIKKFLSLVHCVSFLLLWSGSPSFGQALSGSSLNVTGTGTIGTLASSAASITSGSMGSLVVGGTTDLLGNTLYFGSWTTDSSKPGWSLFYDDGISGTNSNLTQLLTRPQAIWSWQRIAASGSAANVMTIDAANRLILTGSDSSQQIVLDPNGTVAVNGSNLLTQTDADSRYFSVNSGVTAANGNIGVNTSTPQATLDVGGNIRSDNGLIGTDGNGNLSASALIFNSVTSHQTYDSIVLPNCNGITWKDDYGNLANGDFYSCYGLWMVRNAWWGNTPLDCMRIGVDWPSATVPIDIGFLLGNKPGSCFQIVWWDDGGGTWRERLYVDGATGNVGVGTATPQALLDVQGDARFAGTVRIEPQGDLDMGSFTVEPSTSNSQFSKSLSVGAASAAALGTSGTNQVMTSGTKF